MQRGITEPRALSTNLKKYVSAYSRGLSGSAKFRQQTLESNDVEEILELTRNYFAVVKRTPALRDEERAA
jgi:tRNA-dihydrouridine synthase